MMEYVNFIWFLFPWVSIYSGFIVFQGEYEDVEDVQAISKNSLYVSIFVMLCFLNDIRLFDPAYAGFQLVKVVRLFTFNSVEFLFMTGVDGISLYFVFLTLFIFPFCYYIEYTCFWYTGQIMVTAFLLMLQGMIYICFTTLDLFFFFFFFEAILIPMLLLIGCYGSKPRKMLASIYFFLYSFIFSLFSLILIVFLLSVFGTTNFLMLADLTPFMTSEQQIFCWFLLFLSFSAKIPMFPFHLWLPEAHVEAPTVGSIVLSSLLLKLGGYGFIRFSLYLFPLGTYYFLPLVNTLAVLSIFYSSIAALYQLDLKKIIAYSSIAHMNLGILGIFSLTLSGIQGAIFGMFAHSIVSSALFFITGIIYHRYNTRNILYLGGLVQVAPLLCSYFFFFSICNIGFPGTGSFIGEFLSLLGIFSSNAFIFILTFVGSFLGVIYSIRTFSIISFGTFSKNNYHSLLFSKDVYTEETVPLNAFTVAILFMGIRPSFILDVTYVPILQILERYKN